MGALALISAVTLLWRIWDALPPWLMLLAFVSLCLSIEQVVLIRRELRARWRNQCRVKLGEEIRRSH